MKFLQKIRDNYILVTFCLSTIISIFMFAHESINKYDDMLVSLKTTQQMSLKSVIWNDSIPITERASACDVYLGEGYNSMTKKECEIILKRAEESSFFN
ncbi:MAG: hypothetical protein HFI09_04085 [Bacilli bacterium]|nr:hypothetical protein [Bacilli bacterium]